MKAVVIDEFGGPEVLQRARDVGVSRVGAPEDPSRQTGDERMNAQAKDQPARTGETAPPPGAEEIEKALAAAPKYGQEIPPPPKD